MALVCNLSAFTTLFAPDKSWDNVRTSAAPYTEYRLTRSVANERVGFPVVEHWGRGEEDRGAWSRTVMIDLFLYFNLAVVFISFLLTPAKLTGNVLQNMVGGANMVAP
jgi:hypothetical protein